MIASKAGEEDAPLPVSLVTNEPTCHQSPGNWKAPRSKALLPCPAALRAYGGMLIQDLASGM